MQLHRRVGAISTPANGSGCLAMWGDSFDRIGFPAYQGNNREIRRSGRAYHRIYVEKDGLTQRLRVNFPAQQNRELIVPLQGIRSAHQGILAADRETSTPRVAYVGGRSMA